MTLPPPLPIVLATLIAAATTAFGMVFMVATSGVVNIAADKGHPFLFRHFLEYGMRRSVEVNAPDIQPPDLGDQNRIQLGAAHFEGGCAICHGAPGRAPNPVSLHMLPVPPDLAELSQDWTDQELFFVVKHGLKYAGMPAWPGAGRDDEIWSVVAFIRAMPRIDGVSYRMLAIGEEANEASAATIAERGLWSGALTACGRCHDTAQRGSRNALTPALGGQSADYLMHALREYRAAQRESGIMETIAADLGDEEIVALAEYYAAIPGMPGEAPDAAAARGAVLAAQGAPDQGTPACIDCHGPGRLPTYPSLDGLGAEYIAAQLDLWRDGVRGGSGQETLMVPVARGLTDAQIAEVAAYFATRGTQ